MKRVLFLICFAALSAHAQTTSGIRNNAGTLEVRSGANLGALRALSYEAGDGLTAGEVSLLELAANGTNYISWVAPDSITTTLRLVFPNATPSAGDVMLFGAPSGGVSSVTFGKPAALAANGANCSAGSFPLGVDASGAAEGCATVDSAVSAASDTVAGKVELATTAETTAGADATRAVTPDGLAGSIFGQKVAQLVVFDFGTDTATGDGKYYFVVPAALNGMNLVGVSAQVVTAGTTNTTDIQLARCAVVATGNMCSGTVTDMLSTKLTIDSGENKSATAATAAVIDTSADDVATDQVIRVDVDAVSTTAAKGLIVTLTFQLP